ncbi:MAG: hypothetical protein QM756_29975 [Polyangiaceae bacterium]
MPKRELSDDELDDFMERMNGLCERGRKFGLVIDMRHYPIPSASRRRRLATLMDRLYDKHPDVRGASAIVVASAVQRGVLSVLAWLVKSPSPMHPCRSVEEGIAWMRAWFLQNE